MQTNTQGDRLGKVRAAADRVGVGITTYYAWVKQGKMPPIIKVGKMSFVSELALDAAIEKLKQGVAK